MRYILLMALTLSLPYLTDVAADWSFKRANAEHGYDPATIEGINVLLTKSAAERNSKARMSQEEKNAAWNNLYPVENEQ